MAQFSLAAVTVIYALWLLLFSVEKYVLLAQPSLAAKCFGRPNGSRLPWQVARA